MSAFPNSPWWRQDRHADRRPRLLVRNRLASAVRRWFDSEGFVEVETSALQISPGVETHLHAFATEAVSPGGARSPLYLRTSPEFACKKLLTAGERRIFDFAKVWRNRERGALHHPEFTLLEWYRAEAPYFDIMNDCIRLLALTAETAGCARMTYRGLTSDPHLQPQRLTLAEAFDDFADIDLLGSVGSDGASDRDELAAAAVAAGVRVADDDTWGDVFSRVLVDRIEPRLGLGRPTLLYEYPICAAGLARPAATDPRVAERFELYVCGVELANGFGELTDADEQRRRFEAEMAEKYRVYGERYPLDEDFLAALAQMPSASGVALGFDRLVMLATGASHIEQVLWTPIPDSGCVAEPEPS